MAFLFVFSNEAELRACLQARQVILDAIPQWFVDQGRPEDAADCGPGDEYFLKMTAIVRYGTQAALQLVCSPYKIRAPALSCWPRLNLLGLTRHVRYVDESDLIGEAKKTHAIQKFRFDDEHDGYDDAAAQAEVLNAGLQALRSIEE